MRTSFVLVFDLLVGACASTPSSSDNTLAGTDWELRSLSEGGDSVVTNAPDQLHFGTDGSVAIHSCNHCNGTYIAERSRLMMGTMMCTRRACVDEHLELAQLIGDISTYSLEGDWLTIETSRPVSRQLRFASGPPLEGS